MARQYDAMYDDAYWEFHDELTWRAVKPHLPRDASAATADLGCGTGKWGLRLIKSGYATTFIDSSAAMIEQTRSKLIAMGDAKLRRATLLVADIAHMPEAPTGAFELLLAMGDPLSICENPAAAAAEMARITRACGVLIATADNKLAALDHFVERGDIDALEQFVRSGRTHWLTSEREEQFELTTFTPASLRALFERSGFDVIAVTGKPIVPVRANRRLLESPDAVERLLRMEADLGKDPAAAARAGHLQLIARRR